MRIKFDNKLFNNELNRYLGHKWIVIAFDSSLVFFSLCACALAYCHDTYESVFSLSALARMDVWCRVSLALLCISVGLFVLWPVVSIGFSAIFSISSPHVDIAETIPETDDNAQESAIIIDRIKLRKLLSMTENKFDLFYGRLSEKAKNYCKRDFGKLVIIIMDHTEYCSKDDKYLITRGLDKVGNFTSYIADFFDAIGLKPSSLNKGYYDNGLQTIIDDFKDILDIH